MEKKLMRLNVRTEGCTGRAKDYSRFLIDDFMCAY